MDQENSFDVVIRRRVPYFTRLMFYVSMSFFIVLVIFWIIFLPARNSSGEMQVAYYILAIPAFMKKLFIISLIGGIISFLLFIDARFYRDAMLTFMPDKLVLEGKKVHETIPVEEIKRAYCMDKHPLNEDRDEKLIIYLVHKDDKITRIKLKYFVQSDDFMDRLLNYKGIDFKTYNFDADPDPENEE